MPDQTRDPRAPQVQPSPLESSADAAGEWSIDARMAEQTETAEQDDTRISCGCCRGPIEDRCCCWIHQDSPRGLLPHTCSRHAHDPRPGQPVDLDAAYRRGQQQATAAAQTIIAAIAASYTPLERAQVAAIFDQILASTPEPPPEARHLEQQRQVTARLAIVQGFGPTPVLVTPTRLGYTLSAPYRCPDCRTPHASQDEADLCCQKESR